MKLKIFLITFTLLTVLFLSGCNQDKIDNIPSFYKDSKRISVGSGKVTYYCFPNEELQEKNKEIDANFEFCIYWTRNYTHSDGYSEPNGYLFSDYCINRECRDSIKLMEVKRK